MLKGWSRIYVNYQGGWVKRMFRWAAEEELVSGDQFHSLWVVPGVQKGTDGYRESEPVKPVAVEDVEATVVRLPAAHLDMSRPDLWTYKPPAHKGEHLGKDRTIYFGPKGIELLRPWLRADGKPLFCSARSEEDRNTERKLNRQTPLTPSQRQRRCRRRRARGRLTYPYYPLGNKEQSCGNESRGP